METRLCKRCLGRTLQRTLIFYHNKRASKYANTGQEARPCWLDERGNCQQLLSRHLKEIFNHIKGSMKGGEQEEEMSRGPICRSSLRRPISFQLTIATWIIIPG